MAAVAGGEGLGADAGVAGPQRVGAEGGFAAGGGVPVERPLVQRRGAVVAHAGLGEGRQLGGQLQGDIEGAAGGGQAVGEADVIGLPGGDFAAGEDQVHGPRLADQARQAHGAQVDQRHAEPAAEDAEGGVVGGDAQVGPAGQLQAAGHREALDRGDHRLGELQAGGAHRAEVALAFEAPAGLAVGDRLQIGAGAEVVALAAQDGDVGGLVGVEALEGVVEQAGGGKVDGVAPLGAADGDDRGAAMDFVADHDAVPPRGSI